MAQIEQRGSRPPLRRRRRFQLWQLMRQKRIVSVTKHAPCPCQPTACWLLVYAGADLLDAFAVHLPADASNEIEVLARAVFERPVWWARVLTWVRDALMATVGVKSLNHRARLA